MLFTITLSNVFEADSPLDALSQMVAWTTDNAYSAGYRIEDEQGNSVFIDAESVDWEQFWKERT